MRTELLIGFLFSFISAGLPSLSVADDPDVVSPLTSYQFLDTLVDPPPQPNVVSPVVSYQYFDWPGDTTLTFETSHLVSYLFNGPPVISQSPVSQISKVGTNVTFVLTATGSPVLGYQWCFNGGYIPNENDPSLTVSNVQLAAAGDYSAIVWNTYGTATSAVARLHVYVEPPTPQPAPPGTTNSTTVPPQPLMTRPRVPSSTQFHVFTGGGTVDRNKMTIVLTHGWNSNSDGWPTVLKNALVAKGYSANIVAWDWRDNAAEPEPASAAARTPSEGEALGSELIYLLGAAYNLPIHFIGHSLGTMVNCRAADFIHGDAKNSRNSPVKFNSQNTHVTLFDEAELVAAVNGMHVFGDVLLASLGVNRNQHIDSAGSLLSGFGTWTKVIPDRAAWIDNFVSDVGCTHAEAVNVLLWRNVSLGVVDSHGYASDWYARSVGTPLDSLVGHRWSFERSTLSAAPSAGTCYVQELDSDPLTLRVRQIGTVERGTLAFPTLAAYRGLTAIGGQLSALGQVIIDGYMTTIQYAGDLVADFAESFTPLTGDPVFTGTANSTPAYFVPTGSAPVYQAEWDLQFTLQRPSGQQSPQQLRNVKLLENEVNIPTNSVYTLIPVSVPREAVGIAFQFRLDGSASTEFFTMGISNVNYFTMEAKYVEDGVWQATSVIGIPQYAGQDIELLFSLNDDTMPVGALSVRGIQFFVPPPPDMTLGFTNHQPRLSWPVSALGWQLESVGSLSDTNWLTVTNSAAILGYERAVTDDAVNGVRFYRLKK